MERPCIIHGSGGGTPSIKTRNLAYAAGDDRDSAVLYTADKDMTVYVRASAAWISGGSGNIDIEYRKGCTTLFQEGITLFNLDGNKRDKQTGHICIVAMKKGDIIHVRARGNNYLRTLVRIDEIGPYMKVKS